MKTRKSSLFLVLSPNFSQKGLKFIYMLVAGMSRTHVESTRPAWPSKRPRSPKKKRIKRILFPFQLISVLQLLTISAIVRMGQNHLLGEVGCVCTHFWKLIQVALVIVWWDSAKLTFGHRHTHTRHFFCLSIHFCLNGNHQHFKKGLIKYLEVLWTGCVWVEQVRLRRGVVRESDRPAENQTRTTKDRKKQKNTGC